jgi:hypothetical protein
MRIARHFFSYVDKHCSLGPKALLKNAMGYPFWSNTAPIPLLHASVSRTKVWGKSGNGSTGVAWLVSMLETLLPFQSSKL